MRPFSATLAPALVAGLLAACAGPSPTPGAFGGAGGESVFTGSGVGLDTAAARARRDAELIGQAAPRDVFAPGAIRSQALPPGGTPPPATGAQPLPGGGLDPGVVAAVEGAVNPGQDPFGGQVRGGASAFPPAAAQGPFGAPAASAAPAPANTPGISDEQDFSAVSERQTIESDAARIARNRAEYVQIQPQALPERPAASGPNVAAYAVSTTNALGEAVHRRGGIFASSRFERACAEYRSPDAAQAAFLERGGPERDRLGLDPDGDGFACGWDPAPFRRAGG